MTGLALEKDDTALKARSCSLLPANSKYQIMCERGISIITHSGANKYKVYLSLIGK